jgi:hypothetical protein
MTGAQFLNVLCSSSSILGLSDKSSSDTVWRATVLEWLKLVFKDIQTRQVSFHWKFLEVTATASTVANQFYYTLPTDIDRKKIVHVYDQTDEITYIFVPYERFRKLVAKETAHTSSSIVNWTLWSNQIGLYPVPDSAKTFYLDYVQTFTDIADDANSIELPTAYDNIIIDGVMEYVYRFDPTLGNALNQRQIYESGIERMIKENGQNISEINVPMSHRAKYRRRNELDGRNSVLFPLDNTNV